MSNKSLLKLTIFISIMMYDFKCMLYHLNYAVPHFIVINISSPPYVARALYSGHYIQWRYVLLYGVIGILLSTALVLVLEDVVKKEIRNVG